jgi:hypothetical protein
VSGSIEIGESYDPIVGVVEVTLVDVILRQALIDVTTFETLFVEDGACIQLTSPLALQTASSDG